MSSVTNGRPAPQGPGSVSGAPNLPGAFADTFTSRYVDTPGLRQHVVTGGDGPPPLPVPGWAQNWDAWRLVVAALGARFEGIPPRPRGIRRTDKPHDGGDPP